MKFTFTGKLKQPIIDFATHKLNAVIEINENYGEAYDSLKECEKISVEIKPYRKKRSLNANSFYWTLTTKLAAVIGLSNPECHNRNLRRYGQYEYVGGLNVYFQIPDTEESARKVDNYTDYHLEPTSKVEKRNNGKTYREYILLRGSHTYDTAEMARLIDGLIYECRQAGIPDSAIATPDEKRLLKEKYNVEL